MEQNRPAAPSPLPDNEDAMFQRVWQRVTGESDADDITEILANLAAPAAQSNTAPAAQAGAAPQAAVQGEAALAMRPEAQNILCTLIDGELDAWQACRALSCGRIRELEAIAAQDLAHARRISALLFLFFGIRYFPQRQVQSVRAVSLWSGLRDQFSQKRRTRELYLSLAEETENPTLHTLYQELALEEEAHMGRIRLFLERNIGAV